MYVVISYSISYHNFFRGSNQYCNHIDIDFNINYMIVLKYEVSYQLR